MPTDGCRLPVVVLVALLPGCGAGEEGAGKPPGEALPVRGYVLTEFGSVLPGREAGDCPAGLNRSRRDIFVESLAPEARAELEQNPSEYLAREVPLRFDDPRDDPCANPAAFDDPGMHTIDRPLALQRLEPDGSLSMRVLPPRTCPAQEDFHAQVAERLIDNQYWRIVGCTQGYQPGLYDSRMSIRDGSMTILVAIEDVADGVEGEVEVGIYSSHDPLPNSASGEFLPGASLEISDNPRFHNAVRGRVESGVLTTAPFDLRLLRNGQLFNSEYYLRDARLRMELHADGTASGYLGGYWDLEWLIHGSIRFEDERGRHGGVVANVLGYTCAGKYYALKRMADGHPDPDSGECTSISVLFKLEAIPAFVLSREDNAKNHGA